jgi:hypothetical protein
VLDFFRRSYYSLFVAEVQNHGKKPVHRKRARRRDPYNTSPCHPTEAGQEFILFSWKLVLCDLFVLLYVLTVSLYILLVGTSVTTPTVISAIFTCVQPDMLVMCCLLMLLLVCQRRMITGVVFNMVVVSPGLSLLQAILSSQTIRSLERELVEGHERFIKYYLVATEDAMLYASTWNTWVGPRPISFRMHPYRSDCEFVVNPHIQLQSSRSKEEKQGRRVGR